jgi:hypothetical protein
MRRAPILTLLFCALSSAAIAQQPSPPEALVAPRAAPEAPQPERVEPGAGPESAPGKDPLDVRVRRLLDDFNQRHDDRVLEMSSYGKAGDAEPGLKKFADPRKVELELKDEADREQTSEALAKEYAQEARQVERQEQGLQDFIAKRQKTLDDLSKRVGTFNRQDLELAAANLAHQPGTESQVDAIRRRLGEAEGNEKEVAAQRPQIQKEIAGAEEELNKLQALVQSLEKESKAYKADAASAHQNQLNLADRLEFYVVRAQAEDVVEEGRKATAAVRHLSASPEVQGTLASPAPSGKVPANQGKPEKCTQAQSAAKGCAETAPPEPKE